MKNSPILRLPLHCLAVALIACGVNAHAQDAGKVAADGSWTFAVSGDSRNCGTL